MSWMITASGREHHLQGDGVLWNEPSVQEIAHALAQINRFTGHCVRPYSVAEHSLLVASLAAAEDASPITQLAALMHDAHEAYTGDVSSPVKWALGDPWESFEHGQAAALHNSLGLRAAMTSHRASIRRWDLVALATERRDLTKYEPSLNHAWPILDTPGQAVKPSMAHRLVDSGRAAMTWTDWRDEFLRHYAELRMKAGLK